jgi:hypothetical protein
MSKAYKVVPKTGEARRSVPVPNPKVSEKPTRRKFTAEYKQMILQEAAKCKPGDRER